MFVISTIFDILKNLSIIIEDDDNFEIYLTSTIHKALKQFNSIKEF